MKFNDIPYVRPNLSIELPQLQAIISRFSQATEFNQANTYLSEIYRQFDRIQDMQELAMIRFSQDTKNEFYEQEQQFFNEEGPKISQVHHEFVEALLHSKFKAELTQLHGTLLIDKYQQQNKIFSEAIMDDLTHESQLSTEYSKLMSSAQIHFDGKILNLSMMTPYMSSHDRNIRREASLAVSTFFEANEQHFDRIYDDLVKVRTKIAHALGYPSFVELAYDRLGRLDYTKEDVKIYRESIVSDVIPYVNELFKKQQKRIGVDALKRYDEAFTFISGPAKPKGDEAHLLKQADIMYAEMSETTHTFFSFLRKHESLDVTSRPNKEGGGYCTILRELKIPFIFANFNGTAGDVDVLTHEAGHALQMYLSKDLIPEYRMPTMEAAEIHSMSMEFLAWPWMHLFFKEDTEKYYVQHLESALKFLPYGALVDHFQHEVYSNPNMTKEERKETYRHLESIYLPHRDYDTDAFIKKGTFWYRQAHIFQVPFYYIDYTLAQVVALEFWAKYQNKPNETLETYLNVCRDGGSKPFKTLITSHGLTNVFNPGAIKDIMKPIKNFLDAQKDIT